MRALQPRIRALTSLQALYLYRAKVTDVLGILHALEKKGIRSAGAQSRKKKDKQDLRDL